MQHDVVVGNAIHLGLFLGVSLFVFILLVTKALDDPYADWQGF